MEKDKNFKFEASDKIVIWALNTRIQSDFFSKEIYKVDFPLKIIRPLYHRNPNLAAQHGVFTHWKILADKNQNGSLYTFPMIDRTPLDERLRSLTLAIDDVILYKFMVPIAESNRILSILSKLIHTASRIYPGLDGVARETNVFQKRQFLQSLWPM